MDEAETIDLAREVLRIEGECLLNLVNHVDGQFAEAVEMICRSKGRVIVTGIGKSGLIGKKIVATLTSTGTPAVFLHPVEGLHGDLGIVTREDVLLAISHSGETPELTALTSSVREIGAPIIALTGNPRSSLAKHSDRIIHVAVDREACPFGLAPTSSTTAALAMGDAIAIALIRRKNFTERDFFRFHPGGNLGQRLMARVRDVMIGIEKAPRVLTGTPAPEAVRVIDDMNVGFVLITDGENVLQGILTDGDVRRAVRRGIDFKGLAVDDLMTRSPKVADPGASLAETIEFMQRAEITALAVVSAGGRLDGYIHLHDILGRGGTVKISLGPF
ncbi:MAG TPA: KpsF/GutQ family sugar-phosphate isomerase [Syntrophales bacterium]|nr:KpsF/GutQ family sugar-phosphate isomerase [Syntrophales bacterium]